MEEIINYKFVKLLRRSQIRKDMDDFIKKPFVVDVYSHSTATTASIYLEVKGKDRLKVWYKTNWISNSYEFNERGKTIGIQPGCEFVSNHLKSVYEALQRHEAVLDQERESADSKRRHDEREAYYEKVEDYKKMFK